MRIKTQLVGGPRDGEHRAVRTDTHGEPPVVLRVIGSFHEHEHRSGVVEVNTAEEFYLWSPHEGIYRHVPPRPAA